MIRLNRLEWLESWAVRPDDWHWRPKGCTKLLAWCWKHGLIEWEIRVHKRFGPEHTGRMKITQKGIELVKSQRELYRQRALYVDLATGHRRGHGLRAD